MTLSLPISKHMPPSLHIPTNNHQLLRHPPPKDKVVVVLGATGAGKSRLSIDLATHFAAEVINSDKIQVYQGLDITTNKITDEERGGVPHHLLGVVDPDSDFSSADFRRAAALSLQSITSRGRLPIVVGGSNSFIEALVDAKFRSKYDCCFLWVDAAVPVLHAAVSRRVEKMVEKGMVEEVRGFFNPSGDCTKGILRAIGVPELARFFRAEPFSDEVTRRRIMAEAVDEIKVNTARLVCRQLEKIIRLRNVKGWKMHRLDATEVLRRRGGEAEAAWEDLVAEPGIGVVWRFLYGFKPVVYGGVMVERGRAPPVAAAYL
ncbi:isopentenyltransferase 3 [Perilla frutescens var. hirtella]|uniref:adenylate dimethylallyltransferase (ADP/ATP-dependent) n=1 Tax=Perilla frutescens var. hirtella TaxID=608512 RepID=A0AAD4NWF6_PERFH|nr:isopentenyltransferase 3 [Perilla frutescens var. hirtella]